MDHKQAVLHELLQQHQEPFHLKTYIADKRSQTYKLNKSARRTNAPCGFLHVPSGTAAVLIEAATRIQKQRQSQIRNVGLSLFGSFLKILKHRSKVARENLEDDHDSESRFGSSPIKFSPTSLSARRTPDFCSPATSPIRRVKQEEGVVNGGEEEKEQCSPVSVLLDALYEDEDEDEDDDYDVERSYANIERARQHLLERLERFEKLAALEEVDLEQKLVEACDDVESKQQRCLGSRSSLLKESRMKMNKIRSCCRDAIDHVMVEVEVEVEVEFKTEAEETATQLELAIFQELIMEQCFCI